MKKYPVGSNSVPAVYSGRTPDNPFLDAMPDMLSREEFFAAIRSTPKLPHDLSALSTTERRQRLAVLHDVFIPMSYMYLIYDQLYRSIQTTYQPSMMESVRRINAIHNGTPITPGQAETASILGVPGTGKTSTIRRCLALIPQVIEHTQPFCKQVLYLCVECPHDQSVKALVYSIIAALDRAIGSDYIHTLTSLRSVATSALATQVKILMRTHNVGVIVVDEIQNAIETAKKTGQTKPLIRFLVELTNDTSTGVILIGTPEAEELFISQEHLKRRTRGLRILPMKPDGSYRRFLSELWPYQLTPLAAPLTEHMANLLYDQTAGIPAYIARIFREGQSQALLQGRPYVDERIVMDTVRILSIKPPKSYYGGGTSISEFERFDSSEEIVHSGGVEIPETSRQYANPRGRKKVKRDDLDLLVIYESGGDLLAHLKRFELLEEYLSC